MIIIVDYGLGNVQAFLNVYKRLNIAARRARIAADLAGASRVILPGVGAFDHAMTRLERSGLRESLDDLVLAKRIPVLGVCVGMQILAHGSDEGRSCGLGWIDGHVKGFRSWEPTRGMPVPHMGWNDVRPDTGTRLFEGFESEARFYFLHSFFFECARQEDVLAISQYGADFTSAVHHGNVFGVQFHPEKSHHFGTQLLKNFAAL
jgi:imidazole glycerol-phosphate synthase subunit HisH